jgi:hypothetical protein
MYFHLSLFLSFCVFNIYEREEKRKEERKDRKREKRRELMNILVEHSYPTIVEKRKEN